MSIPKLLQDLAVIQKLSDLPNSNDGLTAAELKAKFDEAPLAVQRYINETLIPSLIAAKLPFLPSAAIQADNLQAAVELVQSEIAEVSSGTIANGSVTREKLSAEVIARCYGGVPWVSMVEPGTADDTGKFPVGQLWLRPAFTVTNAAGDSWAGNGCTVSGGVVQGTMSSSIATATQTLTGIGQQGDRVVILFDILQKNPEVSGITIKINGGGEMDASSGLFETTLGSGGSLTVQFVTTWNSAALAYDGWVLGDYTVVVPDAAVRQTEKAAEPEGWLAFVEEMRPFVQVSFPTMVWTQIRSGVWHPMVLDEAGEDGSFLRWRGGQPVWQNQDTAIRDLGVLRMTSGSYAGTGGSWTYGLPVAPVVLVIAPAGGPVAKADYGADGYYDNPTVLIGGATARDQYFRGGASLVDSAVSLSGNALSFWDGSDLCNRAGETYYWVAIF